MKRIAILFIFLTGCINPLSKLSSDDQKSRRAELIKVMEERVKTKNFLEDTIMFNSFAEYLTILSEIKTPIVLGKEDKSIEWVPDELFTYLQRCNYGPEHDMPWGKICKDRFVAIIYQIPTSCDDRLIVTYDYNGNEIDKAIIFGLIGNSDEEKCETLIDSDLNINWKFSEPSNNSKTEYKITETKYSIDKKGNIKNTK